MANCIYCGFPAPVGKDFHPECKIGHDRETELPPSRWKGTTPAASEPATEETTLTALGPVIQKAVFRGVLLAGLAFFGIGIVIGVIFAAVR